MTGGPRLRALRVAGPSLLLSPWATAASTGVTLKDYPAPSHLGIADTARWIQEH